MVSVHVLKVRYGGAELCGAPLVHCVDDQDSSVSLFVVAQQGVAVDPGLFYYSESVHGREDAAVLELCRQTAAPSRVPEDRQSHLSGRADPVTRLPPPSSLLTPFVSFCSRHSFSLRFTGFT